MRIRKIAVLSNLTQGLQKCVLLPLTTLAVAMPSRNNEATILHNIHSSEYIELIAFLFLTYEEKITKQKIEINQSSR
jgi:hypothetical protein